jgi:hypothetical protein
VTVTAVDAERVADEIHHWKKLRLWKSVKNLYVLARLLDGFISLLLLSKAAADKTHTARKDKE